MRINTLIKWLSLVIPLFLILLISAEVPDPKRNEQWWKDMQSAEASTVLLNNSQALIPIKNLTDNNFASVNIGSAYATEFDSILNKYTKVSRFSAQAYEGDTSFNKLNTDLKFFKTIILQVTDATLNDQKTLSLITDLQKSRQLIVVAFGNPNSLKYLEAFNFPIIWTRENSPISANFVAQAIFGGVGLSAKLAEDASAKYRNGDGFITVAIRLKYTVPEELGINSYEFESSVDKIITDAIAQRATPGAAIMVVKDGKVILNKSYGKHVYSTDALTDIQDIFDVASVTKISATTIAAMRLYEQQKLNLNENLGTYLPLARATSKSNLKIKELLLHEAGLTPFIPFYTTIKPDDYSHDSSSLYPVKVADGYYLRKNYYENVMLPRMLNTKLQSRGKYEYSDLSMYFIKEVIERQAAERLDQYVLKEFYTPLGMQTAGFNPRNRFDKSRIVPTEEDSYFRKTLVNGYVHDQGAAMAGGISGHAGLFANTNDLAILFQMLLNGGSYGGRQYFNKNTIDLFTSRQSSSSRRGLGFDRWDPETGRYPSSLASPQTYGHTGYTGTCVWVDPKYNLIYIFLSNRVYPQVTNKLSSMQVRPRIQDAIYKAIEKAGI